MMNTTETNHPENEQAAHNENVGAFLFRLNELLQEHNLTLSAIGYGMLTVHSPTVPRPTIVVRDYNHPNRLTVDPLMIAL